MFLKICGLLFVIFQCIPLAFNLSISRSFPVTTLINSKWNQTPLYMEIAEYLADENDDLFWNFLKSLEALETPLTSYDTESKQYNAAVSIASTYISPFQISLMKLAVSMHSLTPRIQVHLQTANEYLADQNCSSNIFAIINSDIACTYKDLEAKIQNLRNTAVIYEREIYNFDHIYPGSEKNVHTVILYGDIGSNEFLKFHKYISQTVNDLNIRYIVRHYLTNTSARRVRLSSYGVELHLKSTEYKSQDDALKPTETVSVDETSDEIEFYGLDFKILQVRFQKFSHSLEQLRRNLIKSNDGIPQLKAWEFQDLGIKATASIAEVKGEESLQILQYISQNFPMQSRTLVSKLVSDEMRAEIIHNIQEFGRSLNIVPPDGALFVNGIYFDADTIDLGTLLETIRFDMRILENLHMSGISGSIASSLLTFDISKTKTSDFAIDIRDPAIMWVNDIESDTQYHRWPGSVTDLLRPTFPGMLRNIRKNLFNLVLIIDPLHVKSRSIVRLAESFVIHMAPVRLGIVFDDRNKDETNKAEYFAIISAFNYILKKRDPRTALSFLTDVLAALDENETLHRHHIKSQLKRSHYAFTNNEIDNIISNDASLYNSQILSLQFIEHVGFENSPQALLNGVPISQQFFYSDSEFEEIIFTEIMQQTSKLQKSVYRGELTDNDVVIDFLMNQPHVMPRLNQRILDESKSNYLDLSGTAHIDLNNVGALADLSSRDMTATLSNYIKYFQVEKFSEYIGEVSLHFLTIWVVADLNTVEGKALFQNAILYLKSTPSVRVAFIPNTEKILAENDLNKLVWAISQTQTDAHDLETVLNWLIQPKEEIKISENVKEFLSSTDFHVKMLRVYAQKVLNIRKQERLVICNGRLYGPLLHKENFGVDDFALIDHFNALQYGNRIRKFLQQRVVNEKDIENINSNTLLKLYTSLIPQQSKSRFKLPDTVKVDSSVIKLEPKESNSPYFDISAVIDPASRAAQKLAPILIILRNILNCKMHVFLTPVLQHSDMPIKNFYRYVIEPEVQFDVNGKLSEAKLIAKFTGLPSNSLLTQNMHVPDNWLVEAVRAVYDLDNIKLSEIAGPVHSEFELEFLLLEGHCFDATNGAPPRGLQITLGKKSQPSLVDTIVMANLGYFQLKANPGAWELHLRKGKSADIYQITNAEGTNTILQNNTINIVISSLQSHVIKIRATKKNEKLSEDLLGDNESDGANSGIWNSIANSFSSSHNVENNNDEDVINIFSVASGHLYERLLRIMMVSLLKHTESPVKFWFLKNYLSPQFTDFLPHMAKEYNFKYELVQYKWPRWLHQQTVKQRIIWGYKILFLDVLFPLNIRKIIFVDADAIVRTDIKELFNMDLGNAPYAYTPFCDSRKEMEGFRFWKQGYWRSHLMGRRYHISALYVVDLKRFRKIAAGDRLRGQYQALSQDPNSLSNLDQDLPNNMIHQVSIKSLPEEWLWCETWCSENSFKKAKVIDLCNNPQTKEAKLAAAQRIVPEWKDYDEEIRRLMTKIEDVENIDNDSSPGNSQLNHNHNKEHPLPVHSEL